MRVLRFIMLISVILLLTCAQAWAQSDEAQSQVPIETSETILGQAQEAFHEGMRLRHDDPALARIAFDRAIECYQQLEAQFGISNGGVLYNIGNCYLMSNRVGRAIAAYRKALQLRPGDENIKANLRVARHRVADRFEKPAGSAVARAIVFWHHWSGARQVFVLLLGNAVLWITLGVRLRTRRVPRWPAAVGAVVVVVMAGSLWMNYAGADRMSGVVVDGTVIGRQGPGDEGDYEPSFTRALSAGVEFDALEERDAWVLVKLGDGRQTWLPRQRIELFQSY